VLAVNPHKTSPSSSPPLLLPSCILYPRLYSYLLAQVARTHKPYATGHQSNCIGGKPSTRASLSASPPRGGVMLTPLKDRKESVWLAASRGDPPLQLQHWPFGLSPFPGARCLWNSWGRGEPHQEDVRSGSIASTS
jgi:hypothetical protein